MTNVILLDGEEAHIDSTIGAIPFSDAATEEELGAEYDTFAEGWDYCCAFYGITNDVEAAHEEALLVNAGYDEGYATALANLQIDGLYARAMPPKLPTFDNDWAPVVQVEWMKTWKAINKEG